MNKNENPESEKKVNEDTEQNNQETETNIDSSPEQKSLRKNLQGL